MRKLLLLLPLVVSLRANVTLAPLFCDHAVLQRDKPIPVWGQADPGEAVTVDFCGQHLSTTTDAAGQWKVRLDSAPGSSKPSQLVVSGRNTIRITDVLVGEVWLCSGQSNMNWPVSKTQASADEMAAADFPNIRHFMVSLTQSAEPATTVRGSWTVCSPSTVGRYTAVGFYFARDLQSRLGVPIGIINSTWGGTPIEAWMSESSLSSRPEFAAARARWQKEHDAFPAKKAEYEASLASWREKIADARTRGEPLALPRPQYPPMPMTSLKPTQLFNGMVNPLIPYALRGVLWYQGETNHGHAEEYHGLFTTMISDWRDRFGQGNIPFFWVQLANYSEPTDMTGMTWAYLREAQTQTLELPATGQVVTIDLGTPGDIHPRNKREVGRRLALLARSRVYGMPVADSGPMFERAEREGQTMRVHFKAASGQGLANSSYSVAGFEIAGADHRYYPATATIDKETLVVSAPDLVPEPLAVRYGWRNAPEVSLFNESGLPACPFRTDNW